MAKSERLRFTQSCGKNADAVANPLYSVFGVLWQKDWVIARHLAIEKLHTLEAGVYMQVLRLFVQQPQRLHESKGDAISAVSPAAVFANRVLARTAKSLHTLVAAVPTERRHS